MHKPEIPKFSICTTNYNCAHALERHLESIYEQLDENEFEYIVFDNISTDGSGKILKRYEKDHGNFSAFFKKCIRGEGRQMALQRSKGPFIVQVDTDTIYLPIWSGFIRKCKSEHPKHAIQAIFSGVYPRGIIMEVGGWRDFQYYDDFDLWMRVWEIGKMRWYPLVVGENIKESDSESHHDMFSSRYQTAERYMRLVRHEYDWVRLHKYRKMDLDRIWKENIVDLKLGKTEDFWFGDRGNLSFFEWLYSFTERTLKIPRAKN
jgi:glycosyltransferase involved in cell wall biosynthesis